MRKQLHEVQEIDQYLFRDMSTADRLVFHARMILQPELKEKVRLQKQAHSFLRWFSRTAKKEQLQSIHTRLMNEDGFNLTIQKIFA